MRITRRSSRQAAYRTATPWPATPEQIARITRVPVRRQEGEGAPVDLATANLLAAFAPITPKPEPVYLADRARHLVCFPYGLPELHAMAEALGIGRRWFHAGRRPHYDIPKDREAEILARCTIVRPRQILAVIKGGQPFGREPGQ